MIRINADYWSDMPLAHSDFLSVPQPVLAIDSIDRGRAGPAVLK